MNVHKNLKNNGYNLKHSTYVKIEFIVDEKSCFCGEISVH